MSLLHGLDPISNRNARVLILGSMPGRISLAAGQYYANPRNAFWRVMEAILDVPSTLPYEERCALLVKRRVALWDVLKMCSRSGSLDSDIVESSIVANDFRSFFVSHSRIRAIYFNGAKAEAVYIRYVHPGLCRRAANIALRRLPSTSPAHASLDFDSKLEHWGIISTGAQEAV